MLRRVDRELERRFGDVLPLHPARPAHGTTDNPQLDGLFRVTASFTPGFGSEQGKGYVLHLDTVSLQNLPPQLAETIQKAAVSLIQDGLETVHPGKGLRVKRDGNVWKIIGDLSL